MGLPNLTSNYKGYSESNVYDKIEYLRNKMFYLVHGTADDNVQFQQSMALARHLAKMGILFRQQVLRHFSRVSSFIFPLQKQKKSSNFFDLMLLEYC